MNKYFKALFLPLAFMLTGAGLFAADKVSSPETYLEVVGPPALRFQVITPNNAVFLSELTLPKAKATTPPPMPTTPLASAGTETHIAGSSVNSPPAIPMPFMGSRRNDFGHSPRSASDLLNITPQMINDYFKPNQSSGSDDGGSNGFQRGQTIFVPAELGFVPPTSGGHAISNSK